MAFPATTQTDRPLDALRFGMSGPAQITDVVARHLRLLGARTDETVGAAPSDRITLSGGGFDPASATVTWADLTGGLVDEATVQAATGMMAVHGRRDGTPRGLAVDYAATATAVLTVQGLLAGLVGQARGATSSHITARADRAGLLAVSQYLAAAGADEGESAELAPGDRPSLPLKACCSSWRPSTRKPGPRSGGPWRPRPTRYGRGGGPSSSATPPPAHPSPRHSTP